MDIFVARQPIFDNARKVVAYELLFRSCQNNFYACDDADLACSRVISDELHVWGMDKLIGDKRAFINVTRRVLVEQLISVLPRERTVVELLENIEPDDEVIAATRALKDAGYTIALDDFVYHPQLEPLVDLADIIKIDFLLSGDDDRQRAVDRFKPRGITLLAEKVETHDEYARAQAWGYDLFQGYFFCKPELMASKDVPGFKGNYLRFLHALNEPRMNFAKLTKLIKQEVSLSMKLLRYLNSAAFGLRHKVTSIRQALVMLGEQPLKKWASLVAMAGLGEDKPQELVVTSLVRARFCEQLAKVTGQGDRDDDLFMVGLFSTVDVLIGRPMQEILREMSISGDVGAALLERKGPLAPVFELTIACERGDYESIMQQGAALDVDEATLTPIYADAIAWADSIFTV